MYADDPSSEADDMADNTGGRVHFEIGERKRYFDLSGAISEDVYLVEQERSDRKGLVSLKQENGTRTVRVHHRRLLPISTAGVAMVIESQDKYHAICPIDHTPVEVASSDDTMTCPECSQTFNLHWIGAKPMTDTTKPTPTVKAPKPEKANKSAPKEQKPPKTAKEPVKVDLTSIAKLKHCELWTKKNIKFDHERIDVQAHVLLFTGDEPRKLCFNTYGGTLGKKKTALPIDQFIAGDGKDKTTWYAVPDLDKARKKLQTDLYEHCK